MPITNYLWLSKFKAFVILLASRIKVPILFENSIWLVSCDRVEGVVTNDSKNLKKWDRGAA